MGLGSWLWTMAGSLRPSDQDLLRASHIIPWKHCRTDATRLDVHNGLLLSALRDAAFDRGWVTFDELASHGFHPVSARQPRLNCAGRSPSPSRPTTKPIWPGAANMCLVRVSKMSPGITEPS